ncbi:DUF2141 domain-containing protein [Paraglaciecola aquimarina]|uniref:DUF2141 domain-containing protein n=1 Tax=Paraglaciecola aquimarina TaxID=1235557 RepID=A0ABU3SSP4_9ALTE|nr:DUF2141 domain-containing protein [Paraglaciecola aquimarina]MDU0353041.1 DUF2141 domain-containing protein [Paraglaciecola aquimarina]
MSNHCFSADLELTFTTKYPKAGELHIQLFNLGIPIEGKYEWQNIQAISSHAFTMTAARNDSTFTLKNIAPRSLCLRAFLDLNANQVLDKSAMGLPKEPVGLANNPALMFGEPSPDKACFEIQEKDNRQDIALREKKPKKSSYTNPR